MSSVANKYCLNVHRVQELIRDGKMSEFQKIEDLVLNIRERGDLYLWIAVIWGRLNFVQYLVGRGADIHACEGNCLVQASAAGYVELVRCAVELGANIHTAKNDYVVAAAAGGCLELVQYFISQGADAHARAHACVRAASENGHLPVVQYLVELGADIYANDNECIYNAVQKGHLNLLRYFVAVGANVGAGSLESIYIASWRGKFETVKYLVAIGSVSGECDFGYGSRKPLEIANYLQLRGAAPCDKKLDQFMKARACAGRMGAACAPRRLYLWWVPRCFDLARRGGRRTRARNFAAFRRLCAL